ncbi:AMP-binding protein [Nannocystis sp. ILAH1]|uniref:phenylacetate--CoA ligase family protein n=1 Tax=unclassified Nannocystis TaxID=2627009 RepID=UPI00226FDCA1|nr:MULTISPECIES: AMP-binding protein [unclassified Nannocystis]MCY0989614.1 AMP-binding protein [Nannocystis sp. ILAH1]MCY1071286.1 AMP-binding protein [Nannocystis sp. RBIL2]
MADYQEHLPALDRVLAHARGSAFYGSRLPRTSLRTWNDFTALPLTTRVDLRRHSPHGLICVPGRELLQYHESSATTGEPVSVWYSARDLAEIRGGLARWGVGLSAGDRVLVRFPYALSTIGHCIHAAAQHRGACVIPADSRTTITPLSRVLELMRKLEVTVLATISLTAVMIAEAAEMAGLDPRRDFPRLRAICCAGEPLSPHRRELVGSLFGVPVYDNYGMTETGPLAMDCAERRLHPWLDQVVMEVLDDRLEREVAAGEIGHLVVTSLTPRAVPMIRYLTGDRVRRSEAPCPCGRGDVLEVRGRAEDVLSIQGRVFDLWELDAIVSRLPSRRFWTVSPLPDGLRFVVERERDEDHVEPALLAALTRDHGAAVQVELAPKGALYDRREPVSFGMMSKPVYVTA